MGRVESGLGEAGAVAGLVADVGGRRVNAERVGADGGGRMVLGVWFSVLGHEGSATASLVAACDPP